MADDEEYEIMPHRTLNNIKKELEELKLKAAAKDSVSNESFRKSLDSLSVSMNGLTSLFNKAAEEMKIEEETEKEFKEKLEPLIGRVEDIEEQNKAIARAILALSDLIEERLPKRQAMFIQQEPEREVVTKTYRETIMPKGTQLPPIRPLGEAEMRPAMPGAPYQQVQHTFGRLPSMPPPAGGPLPQPGFYQGAASPYPQQQATWRNQPPGPLPGMMQRPGAAPYPGAPLPPLPPAPSPLNPPNLPPLGPAPAQAKKGWFKK